MKELKFGLGLQTAKLKKIKAASKVASVIKLFQGFVDKKQKEIDDHLKGPMDCRRCKCPTYSANDASTWVCDLMKESKPKEVCGTAFSIAAGAQNAVKFGSMGSRFMQSYVKIPSSEKAKFQQFFDRFENQVQAKLFRKTFKDCGDANAKDRTWSLRTGNDVSVISCHTKTFTMNTLTHTKKVVAKMLKHSLCSTIPGTSKRACSEKKVVHSCTMCDSAPDRLTSNLKGIEGVLKFLQSSEKITGDGDKHGNCLSGVKGKTQKCSADVVVVAAM